MPQPADRDPTTTTRKRADRRIALSAGLLLLATLFGVFLVFQFVGDQREREMRAWQVRLGIVADSRTAEIEKWLE